MSRIWVIRLAAFLLFASQLRAQSSAVPQDFTFSMSSSPSWTDTGIDLHSGDIVRVSAVPAGISASGLPACDPAGLKNIGAIPGDLPVPSANSGALIAKFHAAGGAPVLIGISNEFHIDQESHLFLGMNVSGAPPCQGGFTVKVERVAAGTSANSENSQTRGAQLKSQLATAAEVFMSGQLGLGNSSSGASTIAASPGAGSPTTPVAVLSLSPTPLDAGLRRGIDSLPRRVNDQFNNLGDMVNFVIVGNQKDVQAALDAATWHVADTDNRNAILNAVMQTYDNKDYLAMPMSTLYLFGRKQDFGYEMAEPIAMVDSRHHFRIWKAPFTWNGHEVWVGAGTHDIGFAKDKRNDSITHKIDPSVDGERDNIGSSLQKANKAKSLTYYLPPNPVQDAKNATGDGYHSDGRMLVIFLQ